MNLRASLQGSTLAAVLGIITLLSTGCCGPGMIQHACTGYSYGPASVACAAEPCGCDTGACGVAEDCGCTGGCTDGCACAGGWTGGGWGRCTGVNWNPHGLFRHGPFVTLHHMLGGVGPCRPFCGDVGCAGEACGPACGDACGCGGCGETYVGEWISDPPYPTDPCCDMGNCGNRCCGGWLVNGWKTLWGCRYGGVGGCADVGCAGGSCGCGDGSCGDVHYDGVTEVPADIHNGPVGQPQIIEGPSVIQPGPSLAPPAGGNPPKAGGKNPFVPDAKSPAGGSMTRNQPRRSYPGYRAARAGYRTSPR